MKKNSQLIHDETTIEILRITSAESLWLVVLSGKPATQIVIIACSGARLLFSGTN